MQLVFLRLSDESLILIDHLAELLLAGLLGESVGGVVVFIQIVDFLLTLDVLEVVWVLLVALLIRPEVHSPLISD